MGGWLKKRTVGTGAIRQLWEDKNPRNSVCEQVFKEDKDEDEIEECDGVDRISQLMTPDSGGQMDYDDDYDDEDEDDEKEITLKIKAEDIDEGDREIPKGLLGWVNDYKKSRKSGNVKLAKELRDKINTEIDKLDLDAIEVYGSSEIEEDDNYDPESDDMSPEEGEDIDESEDGDGEELEEGVLSDILSIFGVKPEDAKKVLRDKDAADAIKSLLAKTQGGKLRGTGTPPPDRQVASADKLAQALSMGEEDGEELDEGALQRSRAGGALVNVKALEKIDALRSEVEGGFGSELKIKDIIQSLQNDLKLKDIRLKEDSDSDEEELDEAVAGENKINQLLRTDVLEDPMAAMQLVAAGFAAMVEGGKISMSAASKLLKKLSDATSGESEQLKNLRQDAKERGNPLADETEEDKLTEDDEPKEDKEPKEPKEDEEPKEPEEDEELEEAGGDAGIQRTFQSLLKNAGLSMRRSKAKGGPAAKGKQGIGTPAADRLALAGDDEDDELEEAEVKTQEQQMKEYEAKNKK